jgi:Bifunctional DNA primase/polymerase, N-terminal/AAA domain/Primase C terminal 1 (PriCT-1)
MKGACRDERGGASAAALTRNESVTAGVSEHPLEAALTHAAAGRAVLPVHSVLDGVCACGEPTCGSPGKHPRTRNGLNDATTDTARVMDWWTRAPGANVGIATGAISGVVVLDIDISTGGSPSLAKLERTYGRLPQTTKVLTGSGGFHYYFRHPGGTIRNSAGTLGNGIDVRADGGYVIAPPSIHKSNRSYQWLHSLDELADMPEWLLGLITITATGRRNGHSLPLAGVAIPEGRRNADLASLAGAMRNRGMEELEMAAALLVTNQHRCRPPLSDDEVRSIAASISRYRSGHDSEAEWVTLDAIEMRSISFIDRPLLQRDAFHLFVGRKGVGKGTYIADTAARVTRGELGEKRKVLWIGTEDSAAVDIKPRLVAAGGDPARVAIVKKWIQLPDDLDTIRRISSEVGDVGLIVIDPLGNHIAGKNSNSETDIRDAIGRLNALADEEQAMVLGVRHLSEKECARGVLAAILGSSAWVQVPRVVVAVVRDNEDPGISHVQVVAGNRLPPGAHGRMFRLEGVRVDGLEEEVTRAVWIGQSPKDVESLLGNSQPSKSANARELILDILERDGDQESDTLDARAANETGLAARTVRNIRVGLKDEGLIKAFPVKDEHGTILRWVVTRTAAPRS